MKLLLDTHVVLWWQRDDRRLNKAARSAIATADVVWVSAVSGWEVAIKLALGRLTLSEPFDVLLAADDFTELPLTLAHATQLPTIAPRHTDPFDQICWRRPNRTGHAGHARSGARAVWRADLWT